MPLVVGVLVVLHVILVRRHGVVPPFDAQPPEPAALAHTELPETAMQAPTDGADPVQVPR